LDFDKAPQSFIDNFVALRIIKEEQDHHQEGHHKVNHHHFHHDCDNRNSRLYFDYHD
jgi:hypothetical protein